MRSRKFPVDVVQFARFFHQHHGNVIAHRVGKPVRSADEFLPFAVEFELALAHGAGKDFQQGHVHRPVSPGSRKAAATASTKAGSSDAAISRYHQPGDAKLRHLTASFSVINSGRSPANARSSGTNA